MTIDPQIRLKRLHYRSWHRGCKETDQILGNFADTELARLDPSLIDAYERLLDEEDGDIWQWLIGKGEPAAEYMPLIDQLKLFGIPKSQ
jgi:antitoxin CptB